MIDYTVKLTVYQNDDAGHLFRIKQRFTTYINRVTSFTTILEHNRLEYIVVKCFGGYNWHNHNIKQLLLSKLNGTSE